MANEVQVRSSLQINNSPLQYRSSPAAFNADMTGRKGPTPGAFTATTAGTDVDLSELSTPGFCRIMNLDDTNYVEYGIWDPENSKFFPLGEILPGEFYIIRLSRNIQEEYGTGTGTTGEDTNRLRIRANTASCNVLVEAFEK